MSFLAGLSRLATVLLLTLAPLSAQASGHTARRPGTSPDEAGNTVQRLRMARAGAPAGDAPDQSATPVRRFALIIGANNGGTARPALRYAASDAQAMAMVLEQLGGVTSRDRVLLIEPTRAGLEGAISALASRLSAEREASRRIEVVLYYSGHSDEDGLMLSDGRVTYPQLRLALDRLPADVRIAILDSCASGALIREKGGVRRPPFLLDASSSVKGHAFLTSSAQDEAAQESDRLKGSFFTQALITGLRGAADVTGDGRITLNEAYQFAFAETLNRTEKTASGPQHPAYDIRLAGTGDLVLTDLRATSAGLTLTADLEGRLYIRDGGGSLAAELRKTAGRTIDLGFEPGEYHITLKRGRQLLEAHIKLVSGRHLELSLDRFTVVTPERTAQRGGTGAADGATVDQGGAGHENGGEPTNEGDGADEGLADSPEPPPRTVFGLSMAGDAGERRSPRSSSPEEIVTLNISIVPMLATHPQVRPNEVTLYSLGILANRDNSIRGLSAGSVVSWVDQDVRGLQAAGVASLSGGRLRGLQAGGVLSVAGGGVELGLQAAGGMSVATGPMSGVQAAGGMTLAGRVEGLQGAGGANLSIGGVRGAQLAGGANFSSGETRGFQAAGGVNFSGGELHGIQAAGGLNITTGRSTGLQVAGGLNVATGDMSGLQLATANVAGGTSGSQIGVVNVTKGRVRGFQLGVLNFADDCDAPIGLLSITRRGYHNVGIWGDEQRALHLGVKTGGRYLYNHLAVGVRPEDDPFQLLLSLGLGTHLPAGRFFFDIEAMATGFQPLDHYTGEILLNSLRVALGFQALEHLAVVGGLSGNVLVTWNNQDSGLEFGGRTIYSEGGTDVNVWPGLFLGLQF